jgi:hypothetical protein
MTRRWASCRCWRVSSEVDGAGLEHQDAGDDLQAVDDAVLHLGQHDFLLLEKIVAAVLQNLLFMFDGAPLGDVFKAQEDEGMAMIGSQHLAGMEQEDARADARKFLLDQKAFDDGLVDQGAFQQSVQRRDVPATLVQGEERSARGILGVDLEGLVKGVAGHQDGQGVVENEQRLAHRLHDNLRKRAGVFDLVEEHVHFMISLASPTLGLLQPRRMSRIDHKWMRSTK